MKYNSKSITLKVPSERSFNTRYSQSITSFNQPRTELKAKALEVLLCDAYNLHARNIPVEKVQKMVSEVERIVTNMVYELNK